MNSSVETGLDPDIHFLAANDAGSRRKEIRRQGLQASVSIGYSSYRVIDWNRHGISFVSDGFCKLQPGQKAHATLRFEAVHGAIDIPVEAEIVRTEDGKTAARFINVPRQLQRLFDTAIDSLHAAAFAESHKQTA